MSIKAVIFDFGGVLVRTEDHAGRRKWEDRLGIEQGQLATAVFDSETSRLASIGKVAAEQVWSDFVLGRALSDEEQRTFYQDFWAGDELDVRLVDYVRSLRPRYKTAILSNAWLDAREWFNESYGLGDAVDEIVVSAEEGVAKPDSRIYQIAADRLGVPLDEAVFVDDMLSNVEAARAAGMRGVHFQSTDQAIADVERYLSAQEAGHARRSRRL